MLAPSTTAEVCGAADRDRPVGCRVDRGVGSVADVRRRDGGPVLAPVTADVAAGRVPDPVGAALVEVVDHRPPVRPRVAS